MNGTDKNGLWAWLSRNRIPLRIISLSALLLGALILSTIVIAWELSANQRRIDDATDRFHRLGIAAEADMNFAALRYWMTDLSVSLLTLSERNAEAARTRLDAALLELEKFAPEPAQKIREATDSYVSNAFKAVDAYTEGNRILGNTFLAQARSGSDAVDLAFEELIETLARDTNDANQFAAESAEKSRIRTLFASTAILILGIIFTALVLRSILRPMKRINDAMSLLNEGAKAVDLPAEGPDEFGQMARTLRTLSDSQAARRALEARAIEQRRMTETAIETIPDGFALFDAQDNLLLVNNRYREIFAKIGECLQPGTSLETLLNAQIHAGLARLDGQTSEDWIAERLAQHRRPNGMREERKLGDNWLLVTKRKTPNGETIAIYTDITEMKSRQTEMEEAWQGAETANEAKSRFLASMSHELRTPLNAIIGYSEMLIEDATDAGETSQISDLEKIMSSGKNLLSLINDILDLSKVEAGKMEIHVERLDVPNLLEDVVDTIQPLLKANDNKLVLTVDPDVGAMETDKTKLRQNLFNLLSNATKFTEKGTIELNVSAEDDKIVFLITDTGIGMTEQQLANLFQAFVQADETTARNYGGTGLGLAIVREFTELMGGKIEARSKPNEGSSFTMTLPASLIQTVDEITLAPTSGDAEVCILVVDDEPAARQEMVDVLSPEGFRVITAENATIGLELARKHRPAAVVLDVIMPGRDGWSMLREVKEDPALCHIPVILATVLADREMGLAFGAFDYLKKPIDPKQLIDRLDRIASHSGREVLVVDDDPTSRALFRRILVREGWEVREASDGERGLEQIILKRPSLVVLDLMMPNLDGFETLRKIRTTDALADLPVIIATSKDLDSDEFDWLLENSGDVVRKGTDGRAELVTAIRRHVARNVDELKKEQKNHAENSDR
ncbi:MAG: response regulator [Paracoccaceae bacterium]